MSPNIKNKIIAKNTILLYIRNIVSMFISFFTSRLVLNYLGVDDFGVYNVVGGVVLMFSALSATLSGATQRYITYSIGQNDEDKIAKAFSASFKIHAILAFSIFILLETVGLWYVNNILSVPSGRDFAANFIFQTTVIMFVSDIVTLPYNSAVVAYEKFGFYAAVSIFQSILKFFLVFLLLADAFDSLIFYAIIDCSVTLLSKGAFVFYTRLRIKTCKFIKFKDESLYKEMVNFSLWNFWGTASSVVYSHGGNLLINNFFGVTLNAAFGLTNQVQSAITSFVSNFSIAVNPQITKSYASKDYTRSVELVFYGSKLSSFLLLFLCTPVIVNIDYLLDIWLINVPEYTSIFVCASLLASFFASFNNSFNCLLFATGDIKNYQISCMIINIASLFVLYVLYKLHLQPVVMYLLIIVQCVLKNFVMLLITKSKIDFPVKTYLSTVYFKGILFLAIILVMIFLKKKLSYNMSFPLFILESVTCLICVGILVFFFGFNSGERRNLLNYFFRRPL